MHRVSYVNAVATVCLLALVGALTASALGAFSAAAPKKISACAKKKGPGKGLLRLASKCKKGERRVTWNAKGPAGPAGTNGQNGAQGTAGTPGTPGTPGAPGADAVAPSGAVMFFDLASCPAGWSQYNQALGRYIVGTPSGGTVAATVGTALLNQENRATGKHTHGVNDPGHLHGVGYDTEQLANLGNTIGGTRLQGGTDSAIKNTATAFTGITIQDAGAIAGTNAPYVQLTVCRKG
jgi:hypothetical protein